MVFLDSSRLIYLQAVCTFMCQFLSSVRIVESTASMAFIEKIMLNLEDLRKLLSKFGTMLCESLEDKLLLTTYLNLCYCWGELYITLSYYCLSSETELEKSKERNYPNCSATYVSSYLTAEQWSLLSEVVNKSVGKSCKNRMVMHLKVI